VEKLYKGITIKFIDKTKKIYWMSDWARWPELQKDGLISVKAVKGDCYGHMDLYLNDKK